MWERPVSCGREKCFAEQRNLMWNRVVLWDRPVWYGKEQSLLGQKTTLSDRAVSYKREKCHIGLRGILWDMPISCGTDETVLLNYTKKFPDCQEVKKNFLKFGKSWNVLQASNWFLTFSLIASRSKMILLKFDKSWNVLQASKYLFMIFKSPGLPDGLK